MPLFLIRFLPHILAAVVASALSFGAASKWYGHRIESANKATQEQVRRADKAEANYATLQAAHEAQERAVAVLEAQVNAKRISAAKAQEMAKAAGTGLLARERLIARLPAPAAGADLAEIARREFAEELEAERGK